MKLSGLFSSKLKAQSGERRAESGERRASAGSSQLWPSPPGGHMSYVLLGVLCVLSAAGG
jgi:hypothetical protein